MINSVLSIVIPFCLSFVATAAIHPLLVRFALSKGLTDNPNTRKLQVRPIPVLGGIGVFFGVMTAMTYSCFVTDCSPLFVLLGCMMLMMYIGTVDDVVELSPAVRLAAQIAVALTLIYVMDISLCDFYGLWKFWLLPEWFSVPFTIFAVAGIINSLNMIDGVDGLFATLTISVAAIFAVIFHLGGNTPYMMLAVALLGAMIPFMLHNVFGERTKMFVGDSGTLLVGVAFSAFVLEIVSSYSYGEIFASMNVGVVPLMLSTLAIPVFDTVRVMLARMLKGGSPFVADKTHLHHLFIWLGVSHLGTTLTIVTLNLAVVGACLLAGHAGASAEVQFSVVVGLAVLFTSGIYYSVRLAARLSPQGGGNGAFPHMEGEAQA